jgi:TolB protein
LSGSGRFAALLFALAVLLAGGSTLADPQPFVSCLEHTECGDRGICLAGTCRGPNDTSIVKLFPVAVAPFHDLTPRGSAHAIAGQAPEILRGFLSASVFFDVVDPRRTPSGALTEGWSPVGIDWSAWQQAGAYGLVKGTIERVPGDELALDLRFFVAESGRRITLRHDRQLVTEAGLRDALARWADDLVKEFSGRRGVFSTRIAFAKRGPQMQKEVYVTGLDGTTETPITENGAINMLPSWTRDGKQVAYTSFKDGNPDLWVGDRKLSGRESMNTGAAFSPDGQEVALTLSKDGNAEIYVIDPASGDIERRLTTHPAIDTSPTWSPDGQRIAFLSDRTGSPQIWVMNKDGSEQRLLPQAGGYNTSPDWSPNGSLIAYNTMVTSTRFDIYVVDADGGGARRLTYGSGSNEEPSWSPDGRYIVFTSTRGGTRKQLWIMTADGQFPTRVSRDDAFDYFTPAWSPK